LKKKILISFSSLTYCRYCFKSH